MRKLFIMLLALLTGHASADTLKDIDALTWSNRLILIYSEPGQTRGLIEQMQDAKTEIDDRHIIWFIIDGQMLNTNYPGDSSQSLAQDLIRDWFPRDAKPQVVLIGKDGYEKLREDRLDLGIIFGLIDTMPMRQQEMRDGY